MTVEVYDFRRPGRLTSDVEYQLESWLRASLALLPAKWSKHLPIPLQFHLEDVQASGPGDALQQLPDAVVCHRLELGDAAGTTLMVFPRNLSLALLAGMMGDAPKELPQDRGLTPVEDSLWNFLLQEFVHVMLETWPCDVPLKLQVGTTVAQPKRARLYSAEMTLLVIVFVIESSFGQGKWTWLVPQPDLIGRLAPGVKDAAQQQSQRVAIETLVGEMPVELSVRLGATELPVAQLTRLRAGDLVILDQRVSEPLQACIAGQERFRVWPGRVGSRRAFQIDSLVDC